MDKISLLNELLKFASITPNDDGVLNFIALEFSDFEAFFVDKNEVKNLILTKKFSQNGEHLCFGGHIDVVPPGEGWASEPFSPLQKDGFIYARGTQDMKSGVAAFLWAIKNASKFNGSRLSIVLTSDEEGEAKFGTALALEFMKEKNLLPDFAIVAEPTCVREFGDSIKIGRRGSVNGVLRIKGKQGHAAYPEKCVNPVHEFAPVLKLMAGFNLDGGTADFAPSKIVITDIRGGIEATNVTPNELKIMFNVRNSTATDLKAIQEYVEKICEGLDYELCLNESSHPFLTNTDNKIVQLLNQSVQKLTGVVPELNTKGGTSDARFFAKFGVNVAEFGVSNDTIHAINERVSVREYELLCDIFKDLIERF